MGCTLTKTHQSSNEKFKLQCYEIYTELLCLFYAQGTEIKWFAKLNQWQIWEASIQLEVQVPAILKDQTYSVQ